MWVDPVPSSAKTQRSDLEANMQNLEKHQLKIAAI